MANFDLSKLTEGKNPQSVMLEETRGLKNKWEQTGLLEGLKERDQHQMSVLLENQTKQLHLTKLTLLLPEQIMKSGVVYFYHW